MAGLVTGAWFPVYQRLAPKVQSLCLTRDPTFPRKNYNKCVMGSEDGGFCGVASFLNERNVLSRADLEPMFLPFLRQYP